MILNEKQMDAISYGKIAMEQAEEGFVFKRINADQQKAFGRGATLPGQSDEQHALYAAMCDCMAGVVLDFETDSPYLTPVPLRGRPNSPENVFHTYSCAAEVLNVSSDILKERVLENFNNLCSR